MPPSTLSLNALSSTLSINVLSFLMFSALWPSFRSLAIVTFKTSRRSPKRTMRLIGSSLCSIKPLTSFSISLESGCFGTYLPNTTAHNITPRQQALVVRKVMLNIFFANAGFSDSIV
uniref:Uncharacterized protein n=1 Tax=Cacopsylla melanoneura TaxID=428564 RepID=A0A8D8YS82_9HEMI